MLYLYRRRLGITPEQRETLPWWERRAYDLGLAEEFRDPDADDAPTVVDATPDNLVGIGLTTTRTGAA